MNQSPINFQGVEQAIAEFTKLIEKFVDIIKAFIASWKKVPEAANGTVTAPTVDMGLDA